MTKMILEILEELNADPTKVVNYRGNFPLTVLFTHAYVKEARFNLPDGDPPFNPAPEPFGMTPTNFIFECKKLSRFTRTDISPMRREGLFINLLESVHPTEARLLLAVKDQKLHKMFKNLNKKFAIQNGFIPNPKSDNTEEIVEENNE